MGSVQHEDDSISYCGSLAGETFSSRRRKNTCNLRQHSIDVLAQKLREHTFDIDKQEEAKVKPRFNTVFHSFRFVVVMLGGFSLGSMMLLRYNITVAILNMVNQTALYLEEHPNKTMEDFVAAGYSAGGEFHWDNEIQHMIMSWYMVAYTFPQIPLTKLSMMIGSRWSVPLSLGLCALSTVMTPMTAYFGWQYVILLRLINGIGASAILPMMLNIIEQWMPYEEISLGLTCAQLLQATLTAANPLISGYLSSYHWKYAFYVPGLTTLTFCAIWLFLVTDRPDENWLISQKELNLICGCDENHDHSTHNFKPIVKKDETKESQDQQEADEYKATWVDVLKVPSFYAYVVMWCFYCSSYSSFSFILPTYLRQFLKVKVAQNGLFCFLIQSGSLLSVLWPHPFFKLLQSKLNLSITASRRITHFVVCSVCAFTWIYVGFFHETQLLLLFLNRCFQGSNDVVVTGTLMSNYAKAGLSGMAFSMVNTVGNLSVVFASTTIGYVLDYTGQSREGWCWIFSALGSGQIIMFLIFATMINSEPITFKGKGNKNEKKSIDQGKGELERVEIVGKKEGMINNFDKLRESKLDSTDHNGNNIESTTERQI